MKLLESYHLLVKVMQSHYGNDWLYWTPETTEATLTKNFNQTGMTSLDVDRVEALKEVLRNDFIFSEPIVFETCIRLFNQTPSSLYYMEGMQTHQLAYGMFVVRQIVGEENFLDRFNSSIQRYMAAVLFDDDIHFAPDAFLLSPASKYLDILSNITDEEKNAIQVKFERLMAVKDTIELQAETIIGQISDDDTEEEAYVKVQLMKYLPTIVYLKQKKVL